VKYNNEETFKQIKNYFKWKKEKFPVCLNDKLMEIIVIKILKLRTQGSYMSMEETKVIDQS
jgi:hypothetical protein